MRKHVLFALMMGLAWGLSSAGPAAGEWVTFKSLLEEMIDPEALARFPDPAYACAQFSSYDRDAKNPEEGWISETEGWFANQDSDHFVRAERRSGPIRWGEPAEYNDTETEYVMMEADGPGCVVQIWCPDPRPRWFKGKGYIRFYLDGSPEPALEAPMKELMGGELFIEPPLASVRASGWNLYLPVPYATHCKVVCSERDFYYHINYRTYEPGTKVKSFTMEDFQTARDTLKHAQETLADPAEFISEHAGSLLETLQPGESVSMKLPDGPRAVKTLKVRLEGSVLRRALRSTILRITFDGQETVWCPVGDFFGSGIGLNPYQDYYRAVSADGTLTSRWVMPYRRRAKITLRNLASKPVRVEMTAHCNRWRWDERSMYFHTAWRHESSIPVLPPRDWNYVDLAGRGVYVGDSFIVFNPEQTWWGEGDEKIYVDGERFPSHFGTGTEDYYGYGYGGSRGYALYHTPFVAKPQQEGLNCQGYTALSRVRPLDAIPFQKSLRLDMEIWHAWVEKNQETEVDCSAATHWYAFEGCTSNRAPDATAAAEPLRKLPSSFKITGAVECEEVEISGESRGFLATPEYVGPFEGQRNCSGNAQLVARAKRLGEFIELDVPVVDPRPQRVTLYATKNSNYGTVQFWINGQAAGAARDLYAPQITPACPLNLGVFKAQSGRLRVRAKLVGRTAKSEDTNVYFGLDCIVLEPEERLSRKCKNIGSGGR